MCTTTEACSAGQVPNFTWNFPIDCTWTSSNPFGWPRLVILVNDKKMVVRGYGAVHIPTTAGRHVRYVRLFVPKSLSFLAGFIGWLTSSPAEFQASTFPARATDREATRVESTGVVKVVLNVTTVGMGDHGYSIERAEEEKS